MATVPELLTPMAASNEPAKPSLLAESVRQTNDRQRGLVVSTLESVKAVEPARFAQATQLERSSGIDADVLYRQRETMEKLLQGNKYADLYDSYRKTAGAMADGRTAALAQNDIDNLVRIERAAQTTRFNEQSAGEKLLNSFNSAFLSARTGSRVAGADALQRLSGQFDRIDSEVARAAAAGEQPYPGGDNPVGFGFEYLQADPAGRAAMRERLIGRQQQQLGQVVTDQAALDLIPKEAGAIRAEELGGDLAGTAEAIAENPGYAARAAAGAVVSSAEMLIAGAVGGPAAAAAVGYNAEYSAKLTDVMREAGVDLSDPKAVLAALQDDALMTGARERAGLKAAGTTAVDLLGMGLAGNLLVPKAVGGKALTRTQQEAANLLVQMPVQGITEGAGEAAGQFLADDEVQWGEVLLESIAGAGMSSADVAVFSGSRIFGGISEGLAKSRQARQGKQSLDEMVAASQVSELRGLDLQTFAKVTEQQLKDSPMEMISIPVDKLDELNQSSIVPLMQILEAIPGLTEQYAEAEARGGSIILKTSDYLTHFSDYHQMLANSVRIQVDGMSIEDAEAWQAEQEQAIDELASTIGRDPDERDQAFIGLMGELQQAGYRRADAEQYAATHVSAMTSLAARTGKPLAELMARFPLDIRAQAPEQVQRIPVDDMRLAIQRLRAGDVPRPADMFGKSLGEYLRDSGGVEDAGGELAALDTDAGRVGRNRIIRPGGKSLDDAAMQAWERGYFPGVAREDVGPQLIVDAMRAELAGSPRYSAEQENSTLRDQAANLEQLEAYLGQLDVDLATMTDDEVLAILRDPQAIEGQQLNQDVATTAAADAETGKPMTVYFARNTESSKGKAPVGMDFGQKIEPAGEYMVIQESDMSDQGGRGWVYGSITFSNPLVLEHKDTTSAGWKKDLSEMFGGKTGKALANAVKKAGHDGIITRDQYGYSETVNLSGDKSAQQLNQSALTGDQQRLVNITEDEYIAAVNPTGKRTDESDIVIVRQGDLYLPSGSELVESVQDRAGQPLDVYADADGSLYAVQNDEVVGQIENRDGETLNIVTVEAQGNGVGSALAAALIRRDPFAQAGSFSPAGEAARRSAFRQVKAELQQRTLNQSANQTDSARFKIWFGKSKVVDSAGKPLVVYHGTDRDIEAFDPKTIGENFGADSRGFFFISDPQAASDYAENDTIGTNKREGANVIPAYISLQKPLVIDDAFLESEGMQPLGETEDVVSFWDNYQSLIYEWADSRKSDGVILVDSSYQPTGEPTKMVVAFKPEQIKSAIGNSGKFGRLDPNILNQGGDKPRGSITFNTKGRNRQFQISLSAQRDLSTLLHEFGHYYLEVMTDLAADADAPQQVKDDVAAIRKWTGAKDSGPFEVEQHEMFARGFERYLAEGKAPNPELQGAFSRFKRWLVAIYKDLSRLNVELSDEIRAVMDRIVATDEQITNAEQVSNALPMFESAAKAGMTDREYAAYRETVELARDEAVTSVEQQVMREEERRRGKWWREESLKVRQEVSEELDLLPEYAAIKALRSGVMPDGTQLNIKLQTTELRERYGLPVVKKLAFMHAKKDGLPMDIVAPMLGYPSGDEMVKAILGAPPRAEALRLETEQRMQDRHGAKPSGESAERAMDAVHNEKRGAVLIKELNALGKQGNRRNITSQQVLKQAAERIMQQRKVRAVQPFEYQRAEAKAGRLAFEAAAKGDLEAAYKHKQEQLLNFYLWREARKARENIDSIVSRLATYNKTSKREKLGKAGHDYLDQVDAVMEQYEFRNVSLRTLDRRVSFQQWYADQIALGNEPMVPEFIMNTQGRVNYKDLSLEQLTELDEFVANIAHLAKLKNKLLGNQRIKDFDDAKNLLVAAARDNLDKKKPLPIDKGTMSLLAQADDWVNDMGSALLKMEQIVEWLDGGQVDGPWSTVFWQPFVDAQVQKDDLNKEFTEKLMGLVTGYTAVRGAAAMVEQIHIPAIGQALTRNAIISAALNTGNASNRKKLLDGYGWSEQQLAGVLENMTAEDWAFTQSLWDLVETLWPTIEQLEKDLHGIPPPKVEPVTVVTPFGDYRGGYWPLVYDTSSAAYAGVAGSLTDGTGLFEQGYAKATTPKGHTKARVDAFAAPILLDTGIVASHLGQVIHDLTHRRAIRDAAKIIGNREIKQALNDTLGVRVADQFNPWLQGVANDMVMDSQKGIDAWTRLSGQLRANLSVAWMGFSATTGMQQVLGLSGAYEYMAQKGGRRYLLQGLQEFVTHPFKQIEFVNGLSGEMRNRSTNLDQNMREVMKRISGKTGGLAFIQRLAFKHIGVIQATVDYPTWLAGYHQAMASGMQADQAVAAGDRAVRLSQMAAGPKDLAAVQRKDGLMKALTIVYSYFNLLYNRQTDIKRSLQTAKGLADYLNAFERTMFLIAIPAILGPLMTGQGPGEDEEWSKWITLKALTYPLMGIPLVRDVAGALESGWGYRGATPLGSVGETLVRLSGAATAEEPDAERLVLTGIDLAGYTFGLPAAQPKRTVKYLFDVAEGEVDDDGIAGFIRGVLFGPEKKE